MTGGFFQKLAAYGHMGKMDLERPWKATVKATMVQEHGG
jgi:S-adenosylmethionine synthetase